MSALYILVIGVLGMTLGWFFYSKFIAHRIYKLDPDFKTPAHEFKDGIDYSPTNKYVLWGHHFTSVAGAAPIVGPAIAVYWGWLPAVLWVTIGTVFFAGVHDFGALWASVRHKGKSMGIVAEAVIGSRTRALFMVVVFLVLLMVNAVFGVVIARSFVSSPTAVFPAWSAVVVALLIGVLLRRGVRLGWLTIIGVGALYLSIYLGSEFPLNLPSGIIDLSPNAVWIILLFIYAAIASMLPVWLLLQPRDYINGIQLFIGLILLYGGAVLVLPDISAPMINAVATDEAPSLIPLLFVTIACGAVSGFHGIVSSGTTSKQLDKEPDARFVGYLGAVGEGSLALITIVAVTSTAFAATPEVWHHIYEKFGSAGAGNFIQGGASLVNIGWGIPFELASTLLATMVVLFAATTMDSGLRLQRYIIQEWGEIYDLSILKGHVTSTLFAVILCLALAFGAGGLDGSGGLVIWPLFGSTNQILAGLTLLVITVMLMKLGRPVVYTLVPMGLVLFVSAWAALIKLFEWIEAGNWVLVVIDLIIILAAILVLLEAASAVVSMFKQKKSNSGS